MGGGISGLVSGRQGSDKTGRVEATEFFPGKLETHYDDHSKEFKLPLTIEEYEAMAKNFVAKEPTRTTMFFYDIDDILYRYDKKTNEFGMCTPSGVMITYFLPTDKLSYIGRYNSMQYNRKCACCGNSLSPYLKFFDICDVCGWEDDPIQNDDPDYDGGANHISLNEAKQAFSEGKALRPLKKAAYQRWQQQEEAEAALQDDEVENPVSAREPAVV
jgi:hypothetical protein